MSEKVGIIGHDGAVGERHQKAWEDLKVPWRGCDKHWYQFIKEPFKLIDIATPIHLHSIMIYEAVKQGKFVICEKPMAQNTAAAEDLIERLAYYGDDRVCIVYQYRFNPKVLKLKREIDNGKYGDIKLVTVNYYRFKGEYYKGWKGSCTEAGGGVVMNVTIHYLDLIQWMFGYPLDIAGFTANMQKGIDVEDTAVAIMQLPGGAVASFTVSSHVKPQHHMEMGVYGTKGHVRIQLRENEYHKDNFQAFLDNKNYVKPSEALKSLQMAEDIYA